MNWKRLVKNIDFKIFVSSISIVAFISFGLSYLIELPWWSLFLIILFSLFLNSFIVEWGDNKPGGFNNPE